MIKFQCIYDGEPNTCRHCKEQMIGPKFKLHLKRALKCKKGLYDKYFWTRSDSEQKLLTATNAQTNIFTPTSKQTSAIEKICQTNRVNETPTKNKVKKISCWKCRLNFLGNASYFHHEVRFF